MGETKLRGGISVSTFSVQRNKQEPTEFILDAGTHIVHLRVSSSIIRDKWVDAIQNSQELLRRIVDGNAQERAGHKEDHTKPGFVELYDNDYNGDGLEEQVKMHNQYLTSLQLMRDKMESFEEKRRADPTLTLNDLLMDAFAPKEYLRSGEVDEDRVLAGLIDMVSLGITTMTSEQSLWMRKFKAEGLIPAESMEPSASIFDGSGQTIDEALKTADRGEVVDETEKVVEILDVDLDEPDLLAEMEFFDPVTTFRAIKLTGDSEAHVKKVPRSEGMEDAALKLGWSRKGPAIAYRAQLPPQKEERFPPSLMSLVSSTVGQDLATVDMPITLSEPISLLQRNCEDLEYSEILDRAAETGDPHTRLALAAIFAISHYAASDERFDKPFTSFTGETYEMINEHQGQGFRVVIESLQKAPAHVAFHAESLGIGVEWKYYYSLELKQAFYGKSMELASKGSLHIEFPKYGDHITYNLPTTCVHNIVFGKMWVENYGDLEFTNHATGDRCLFTLQKSGWKTSKSDVGNVRGVIMDSKKVLKGEIGGNWKQEMHYKRAGSKKIPLLPSSLIAGIGLVVRPSEYHR
uniref:PH domain-containing protein n=2 Tax=Rhodosorus marinus TaxID=101924 RepID=A0A7S2ZVD2_9RHOD